MAYYTYFDKLYFKCSQKNTLSVYQHYECFRQLVMGGADLCLPVSFNGAGGSTSVLNGILRYACDVRYAKLLALCGGVQSSEEVEDVFRIYRNRLGSPAKAREECLSFLAEWRGKVIFILITFDAVSCSKIHHKN